MWNSNDYQENVKVGFCSAASKDKLLMSVSLRRRGGASGFLSIQLQAPRFTKIAWSAPPRSGGRNLNRITFSAM
jgi:hypothetical protein